MITNLDIYMWLSTDSNLNVNLFLMNSDSSKIQKTYDLLQRVFELQLQMEKRLSVIEEKVSKINTKVGDIDDEFSRFKTDLTIRSIFKL